MTDTEIIVNEAKKYIEIMPGRRAEIIDLADLALTEIDGGESLDNELELMVSELDTMHDEEFKK